MATPTPSFHFTSTQTALALIPPSHLHAEINSLRSIHDKAFKKWDPHINIIYPFIEPSFLPSAISIIRKVLFENEEKMKGMRVKMDEVGVFKHTRNATVWLGPNEGGEQSLNGLRGEIVRALGCSEGEGTREGVWRPHLTVGQAGLQGGAVERLEEKVGKLKGLEWEVESLVVLKREVSGEMKVVKELVLCVREERGKSSPLAPTGISWKPCHSFSLGDGWRPFPGATQKKDPIKDISISTYNIMNESSGPSFTTRLPLIISSLSSTSPSPNSLEILCLQEVNEEMLPLLLNNPYIQKTYPYSTHSELSLLPSNRNLVALASEPFTCFTLQFEERHKSALIILFREIPLVVAIVHLTSALTNEAVATKRRQLETLSKYLIHDPSLGTKNIIIAGDFNLTTSSRTIETTLSRGIITSETAKTVREMINTDIWDDVYISLRGTVDEAVFEGEEGATFDQYSNPLAALSMAPIDNSPQRYDRILFHKESNLQAEAFELFGLPTKDGRCGSDHYGVFTAFKMMGTSSVEASTTLPRIEIIPDSTNLYPLLESYLPTPSDENQRREAITHLYKAFTNTPSLSDLTIAPLGSQALETYFPDSDIDVLAIGSVLPSRFFNLAIAALKTISMDGDGDGERSVFKGIHFVNSLVGILEVRILGIKFDVQYCQAEELVKQYHTTRQPDLQTLVLDKELISTLAPSSLRPLNTYRDTAYLLCTLPSFQSYRLAHRFLSLYLKSRGLYSAKFGYLGGIHLSLLLNRVMKLMVSTSTSSQPNEHIEISPAAIIRTFFNYYSTFDWSKEIVADPDISLDGVEKGRMKREDRDAVFIQAIHLPTARPNVASSCTRLSAQTLTGEFLRAKQGLERGEWGWCLRSREVGVGEFFESWGSFVRIGVEVWDFVGEGEGVRMLVGGVESKVTRLLVGLGRIEGVEGRAWPERFRCGDEEGERFKGWYFVGVRCTGKVGGKKLDGQERKLVEGKVMGVVREFEGFLKESRELEAAGGNAWVGVDVVSKKKVKEMGLVVDGRDCSEN